MFCDIQIFIITNCVVVSSVGIKKVDCILYLSLLDLNNKSSEMGH